MARVAAPPWILLAILCLLNVLNFLDRQLVPALAPQLASELGLTHTQLGLLVGFAFVLFFAFAGLAMGGLADRVPRTRLIAAGVAVWSLATAASGAARGFLDLALARLLVGLGEATLVPAALSLLADRCPPSRLGLVSGLFWAGMPLGRALSYLVAGALAPLGGWRLCFFALGAVGLLAAAPLLFYDDTRRVATHETRPSWRETLNHLRRALIGLPALRWVMAGAAGIAFAASASQLEVAWLVGERGFTPARAALLAGMFVAGASLIGNPLVGALADWWERRRPGGRMLSMALTTAIAMPLAGAFYVLPPGTALFYGCWFASQLALGGWQGASSAALQELAPGRIRATTIAFALVAVNLLGVGPGAFLAGAIGDARSLTAGLLLATGVGWLAAIPCLLAARRYATDRDRARV